MYVFFKWSANISSLDILEVCDVRMAHSYLNSVDFSPTIKGVKGYTPGSVKRMSRSHALDWRENWSP